MSALPAFVDVTAIRGAIGTACAPNRLDELARLVWRGYGEGAISDGEAEELAALIEQRRSRQKPVPARNRFQSRQRPRSRNRQASRDRRRRLGGSSALPDTLRHHYTEGQRAVLCIIAGEVKHHGVCDLPVDKIAALAGVCRTTVQTTLHEARRLGHIGITERPVPGRKHLPNLVEIVSPEWRTWIKRGPTAHRPIGSNSPNLVSTTKNTDSIKLRPSLVPRPQVAWQWSKQEQRQLQSEPQSIDMGPSTLPRCG